MSMHYSDKYYDLVMNVYYEAISKTGSSKQGLRAVIDFHDTEQALSWNVDCKGCSNLLDRLYELEIDKPDSI